MAVIIQSLKDFRLSSSPAQASYEPADRMAVVRNVRLANAGTDPASGSIACQSADIGRDTTGQSNLRKAAPLNLVIPVDQMLVLNDEFTLGDGDKLQITLDNPTGITALDVVISGIEREV